ncbi:MAG: hypothetical protein R3Y22_02745 [Bacteroidales bacterium]
MRVFVVLFLTLSIFVESANGRSVIPKLEIAERADDALTADEFYSLVNNISLDEREEIIYDQVISGNIPAALRNPVTITERLIDNNGAVHEVTFEVLPDYLSIGSDTNFIRIPMLPETAQRIADKLGATLPTRKISDLIHQNAIVKLTPEPMTPDSTMVTVPVFYNHNQLINIQLLSKGYFLGVLVAGNKKDIVITNRLSENPQRLFIYGWHYADGRAIQPLSNAHGKQYVDYSHGVRFVNRNILVDGKIIDINDILSDPVLYTLLSDECGIMEICSYSYR